MNSSLRLGQDQAECHFVLQAIDYLPIAILQVGIGQLILVGRKDLVADLTRRQEQRWWLAESSVDRHRAGQ